MKAKQNFIDKTVSFFNPVAGVKRLSARAGLDAFTSGGAYHGSSSTRSPLRSWASHPGDADKNLIRDLPSLRSRSRDAARNQNFASGAINTVKTNVVGSGLKPQSSIDHEAIGMSIEDALSWQKKTEKEFMLWADSENSDARRTLNFFSQQRLAFESVLLSGDVFVVLRFIKRGRWPYRLALQLIEADQVANPVNSHGFFGDIVDGVEKDANGAPKNYYVRKIHPHSCKFGVSKMETVIIPAFGRRSGRKNIIHLFDVKRPGQTRGIPYLSTVIEPLKQLGEYTDAELMAAVISSFLTVFVKNEKEGVPQGVDIASLNTSHDGELNNFDKKEELKLGKGTMFELHPGQSIDTVDPNRPNQAFDGFMNSILVQIGSSLELPIELLTKQFRSSYSASRASMNEAWKFFRERREWLSKYFCQPIYEEWLSEAVSTGRISAPGFMNDPMIRRAYSRTQWIGPSRGTIDPEREVKAAVLRVRNGFSTRAQETASLTGMDFDDNVLAATRETELMESAGLGDSPPENQPTEVSVRDTEA